MTGPVVAGHQPNFFPWFGYFEKMLLADVFVFSDDVQYTKQNYVNRVEIPVGKEMVAHHLTLQVMKGNDQRIADKYYLKDARALAKLIRTIELNLGGLPYFADVANILAEFETAFWRFDKVGDLNIYMNTAIASRMGIQTPVRRGTELGLDCWQATERLIRRQLLLESSVYLSGAGASGYTDTAAFAQSGITLRTIAYRLGLELFGSNVKYSVLFGIGMRGCGDISNRANSFKKTLNR